MSFLSNDKLVLSDSKRMFVLNAMSGEILWNYTDPNNFGGVCIIDNNIYIAEAVLRETSTMYRFDINTGVNTIIDEIIPIPPPISKILLFLIFFNFFSKCIKTINIKLLLLLLLHQ